LKKHIHDIITEIENLLGKVRKKVNKIKENLIDNNKIDEAMWASDIETDALNAMRRLGESRSEVVKFSELSKKFRDSPEELIYLLSIPDIPVTTGSGKKIAEAIAGYKGLGIETIDHKLDEVRYEGIVLPFGEAPLSEVSMTSFMYRVPPFELTRPTYEGFVDKEITDILGARFVWLVKPSEVDYDSWRSVLRKTDSRQDLIVKGKYGFEYGMVVPSTINLVDLSSKSFFVEVTGRYPFFIKFGSSKIEREGSTLRIKQRLLQHLEERVKLVSKDLGPVLGQWKLRIDYPYFCYKGMGISTDPYDKHCPFVKRCPFSKEKGGPCDGDIYWSARYWRRKFYPKVYPLRRLRFSKATGLQIFKESFPFSILRLEAFDRRHVESRWYGVEIGTWFIRARPTVRIFFDTEIGYGIPTSVLELSFDRDWIKGFVEDLLKREKEIRQMVVTKFLLHKALGTRLDYKRLSKVVSDLTEGESEIAKTFRKYVERVLDEDIIDFSRRILLHSLKHMFTQYVLEKVAGVDMNFILAKYNYKYSDAILLAENARNGRIGIVDTVIRVVNDKGFASFVLDFANWLYDYLYSHTRDFERLSVLRTQEAEKTIRALITRFEKGTRSEKELCKHINAIIRKVKAFKNKLDETGVKIDIATARTVLLAGEKIKEEEVEKIEDYFDDILEMVGFHLCLDGCNGCVILEKYCSEGVRQILTTSKTLLFRFVEMLRDLISRGWTIRSTELGKNIEPLLFKAKKNFEIVSPYISPRYANKLVELSQNGVKVRVITWLPKEEEKKDFDFQIESLRILRENVDGRYLSVRVMDKPEVKLPHDKTYISDDIVVTGSFNLTESGLFGNWERAEIKIHPATVLNEKNQFERLWQECSDITKYKIL